MNKLLHKNVGLFWTKSLTGFSPQVVWLPQNWPGQRDRDSAGERSLQRGENTDAVSCGLCQFNVSKGYKCVNCMIALPVLHSLKTVRAPCDSIAGYILKLWLITFTSIPLYHLTYTFMPLFFTLKLRKKKCTVGCFMYCHRPPSPCRIALAWLPWTRLESWFFWPQTATTSSSARSGSTLTCCLTYAKTNQSHANNCASTSGTQ